MEKKILFGTLGGLVTGVILAMAIFMGILGGMAEKWQAEYASCLNMNMTGAILGSTIFSLFMAILLHKFGVNNFKAGAIAGGWITLLLILWFALWNASTFTAYPWSWVPYDVIGNTIIGAVAGGVVGWIYGKVK